MGSNKEYGESLPQPSPCPSPAPGSVSDLPVGCSLGTSECEVGNFWEPETGSPERPIADCHGRRLKGTAERYRCCPLHLSSTLSLPHTFSVTSCTLEGHNLCMGVVTCGVLLLLGVRWPLQCQA